MSVRGILRGAINVAGATVKMAGPVVAGFAAGGPAGAGLAVVGQFAGGQEKRRGKNRENTIGAQVPPVHKITAPVAAIAAPTALAAILAAFGVGGGEALSGVLCGTGPAGAGATAGVIALLAHQLGHGLQDATRRR